MIFPQQYSGSLTFTMLSFSSDVARGKAKVAYPYANSLYNVI